MFSLYSRINIEFKVKQEYSKIVLLHPISDVTIDNLLYVMVCLVNMYRQCLPIVSAGLFVCWARLLIWLSAMWYDWRQILVACTFKRLTIRTIAALTKTLTLRMMFKLHALIIYLDHDYLVVIERCYATHNYNNNYYYCYYYHYHGYMFV